MLNQYFDKIFCINLDRRLDRWKQAQDEFAKFNLQDVIERFSAADGKTLTNNTSLLAGELGCLESHLSILKHCVDIEATDVLILEDDVVFTPEFSNFEEYIKAVPDNWDYIYFGGNHTYGNKPEKINDKVLKLNLTFTTHCLAIKNTIFKKLIKVLSMRKHQVDKYYAYTHKITNAYGFYPAVAVQREGYSDIQNKVVNYDHFLKPKKLQ